MAFAPTQDGAERRGDPRPGAPMVTHRRRRGAPSPASARERSCHRFVPEAPQVRQPGAASGTRKQNSAAVRQADPIATPRQPGRRQQPDCAPVSEPATIHSPRTISTAIDARTSPADSVPVECRADGLGIARRTIRSARWTLRTARSSMASEPGRERYARPPPVDACPVGLPRSDVRTSYTGFLGAAARRTAALRVLAALRAATSAGACCPGAHYC
jgi:hypothetical protein